MSEKQFINWFYLLAGGSSLIFSHAPECRSIFQVDPHDEDVVDKHAEIMVAALLGSAAPAVTMGD